MPLAYKEIINPDVVIGLWRLDESPGELKKMVALDHEAEDYFTSFSNEKRKKQWLGYRLLLQQLLEVDSLNITYDKSGKPFIPGASFHFSVSHSGEYSAAIIDRSNPVGIDIEKIRDRIERVKERFLSEMELQNIGTENRNEKLHVCWGAKESLYKAYGNPEVDFMSNMHLTQFDYLCSGIGAFKAIFHMGERVMHFRIHYRKLEDYMLVWAVHNEQ